MPFHHCLNPSTTRYYWGKIHVILISIFAALWIGNEVTNILWSQTWASVSINTFLNLFIIYLNTLQIVGSVFFGKNQKDMIKTLSKLQVALAIVNALTMTGNNVWTSVVAYLGLTGELNTNGNTYYYVTLYKYAYFALGTAVQSALTVCVITVMKNALIQLKHYDNTIDEDPVDEYAV